jgi:hypothetical protein
MGWRKGGRRGIRGIRHRLRQGIYAVTSHFILEQTAGRVRGPTNIYRLLTDSNADWGQGFRATTTTIAWCFNLVLFVRIVHAAGGIQRGTV